MVTCARCWTDYADDSPSITWSRRDEEWQCTYGDECDEALLERQQAGDHPDGF